MANPPASSSETKPCSALRSARVAWSINFSLGVVGVETVYASGGLLTVFLALVALLAVVLYLRLHTRPASM